MGPGHERQRQQPSAHTPAGLSCQRLETHGVALLIPSSPALCWVYLHPQLISALLGLLRPLGPQIIPKSPGLGGGSCTEACEGLATVGSPARLGISFVKCGIYL